MQEVWLTVSSQRSHKDLMVPICPQPLRGSEKQHLAGSEGKNPNESPWRALCFCRVCVFHLLGAFLTFSQHPSQDGSLCRLQLSVQIGVSVFHLRRARVRMCDTQRLTCWLRSVVSPFFVTISSPRALDSCSPRLLASLASVSLYCLGHRAQRTARCQWSVVR